MQKKGGTCVRGILLFKKKKDIFSSHQSVFWSNYQFYLGRESS